MKRTILLLTTLLATPVFAANPAEQARWKAEAAHVDITRDDWGIAHVHGKSDADAVFGAIYAQAEDDFPRIEANYLTALGRTAEAEGEGAIWQDLRQRLWIDPVDLQAQYRRSPLWLRALMDAWADGLNFYLATHSETKPKVLTHFEPWMALSFTEGSIGGDIEHVDLSRLADFYGKNHEPIKVSQLAPPDGEPRGSNGIAIGPKLSRDGHAMLLINPHTSFFFRSELGMRSDAGLHAYGASTWGQFFLYQGFNAHLGWMHTSSGVDSIDDFAETIVTRGPKIFYRYGRALRPVTTTPITIRYRTADGGIASRTFPTFSTHHGPIVATKDGKWIATALMNKPIPALEQSWLRTKATDFAAYRKVAALQANSSNDTIYADAQGHIAYLHPQFVPVREDRFDYRLPVDGADPKTDWHGLTPLAQLPTVIDPKGGWLYNSNDAPWRAAGADSPRQAAFPRYMDQVGPNARGDHATTLLPAAHGLTPDGLRRIAYDSWMPTFAVMVPRLAKAWEKMPAGTRKDRLADPVASLKAWDKRWSAASTATSLAVFWGTDLWGRTPPNDPTTPDRYDSRWDRMAAQPDDVVLGAFDRAVDRLTQDFGRWQVPWGEINRFQRNDAAIRQTFDDAKASTPVPFTSALWGSLASFGAKAYPGTKRWYGTSGNSFVAVVEFGPKVRAWAVTAGGESGHPQSPHFKDEVERYASGDLRPVYFYPDDLKGHVERRYRPGD
ncbi:penicillin acylase family protein [Sphingomonas sp. MMS24-J13]|uniref:penicillin acylase family protein n=1 Tax=Sphingomonas sp. MMS24-J13 TaxID=3238686 RepID=UPI00384E03C4